MKCEYCGSLNSEVKDSRQTNFVPGIHSVRRRRKCLDCSQKFTTYELKKDDVFKKQVVVHYAERLAKGALNEALVKLDRF